MQKEVLWEKLEDEKREIFKQLLILAVIDIYIIIFIMQEFLQKILV
jgi:hypothetical protein